MNTKHIIGLLGSTQVLGELSVKELEILSRLATPKTFSRGEIICLEGEHWPYVILVISGIIETLLSSPEGRTFSGNLWKKGDVLWSPTIFDGGVSPATVRALRNSTVCIWEGEMVLDQVVQNSQAVRKMLSHLASQLRDRREAIYTQIFNPVSIRVAEYILDYCKEQEEKILDREFTLEEIASQIAASPEGVCRVLYQFQKNGLLKIDRNQILVLNTKALENLAGV